jgi:hypothetical protein
MALQVEEIFGIAAIEDREGRVQANTAGVFAKQARADAMESTRPGEGGMVLHPAGAENPVEDLARPTLHLLRSPSREREEQDALWIRTRVHQVCNAVGKRVCLAGSGPSDDQQRPVSVGSVCSNPVLNREPLLGVKRIEVLERSDG